MDINKENMGKKKNLNLGKFGIYEKWRKYGDKDKGGRRIGKILKLLKMGKMRKKIL